MSDFNNGDIVEYSYWHSLNRKSKTFIIKNGVFIKYIKQPMYKNGIPGKEAVIKLNGNKTISRVYLSQIKKINCKRIEE